MGIISRFKDIMSSNVNALLDKMEDPSKMVDQLLRDLQDDLGKVKSETAAVIAEETRVKRVLGECNEDIIKMGSYAEKAVIAGNDNDALEFLKKKSILTEKQITLQQAYDLAATNAAKLRQMHDKLNEQVIDLNARRETIKAKVQVAKAQERINKIGDSIGSTNSHLDAFSRMEDKADAMLDKASAMSDLNSPKETVDDLVKKYDSSSVAVDDELAALKAKLGK